MGYALRLSQFLSAPVQRRVGRLLSCLPAMSAASHASARQLAALLGTLESLTPLVPLVGIGGSPMVRCSVASPGGGGVLRAYPPSPRFTSRHLCVDAGLGAHVETVAADSAFYSPGCGDCLDGPCWPSSLPSEGLMFCPEQAAPLSRVPLRARLSLSVESSRKQLCGPSRETLPDGTFCTDGLSRRADFRHI